MTLPEPGSHATQTPLQWAVRVHAVALFAVLCLAAPVCRLLQSVGVVAEVPQPKTTSEPENDWTWHALRKGRLTRRIEQDLLAESPVAFHLRGIYRETQDALGVLQTQQVFVGPGGWFFLRHTAEPDVARVRALEFERRGLFAAIHAEAEARDVAVLVAVVPDKVRVYADEAFAGGTLPADKAPLYAMLQRELADAGLASVDLAEVLAASRAAVPDLLYHEWDTHWTGIGALAAARAIAAELERRWGDRLGPRLQLELRAPGVVEMLPDLVHLTGMRTRPEVIEATKTRIHRPASLWTMRYLTKMHYYGVDVREPDGRLRSLKEFEDEAVIAVAGSSFSRSHGGTAVAFALQRPVDNAQSREGAVSVAALRRHFDRIRDGVSKVRVIVWEFPERAMLEGLGQAAWRL